MLKVLIIALSGAAGTLARYSLGGLIHKYIGAGFPLGTFIVNAVGCFIVGYLGTRIEEHLLFSQDVKVAILIGFLGAFTTYSTFAFDTWSMFKDDQFMLASLNVFGGLVLTFGCLLAGVMLAKSY